MKPTTNCTFEYFMDKRLLNQNVSQWITRMGCKPDKEDIPGDDESFTTAKDVKDISLSKKIEGL